MGEAAKIINLYPKEGADIVKADLANGFDRLAHELTNALANPSVKLSAREYQIILAVISKTYRYHKKMDWIANVQLSNMTGIKPNHVAELKKGLIAKNVLLVNGRNIGINPMISDWGKVPETGLKSPETGTVRKSQKWDSIVPEMGLDNPENGTKKSQKRDSHKKTTTTKETITKEKVGMNAIELPDFLPRQNWLEYIEHRKSFKPAFTELAATKFLNKIQGFHERGIDVIECINESITNGWKGIFEPKPIGSHSNGQHRPQTFQQQIRNNNQQVLENFVEGKS